MRSIDTLVIHCAATPNGRPFTVRDIDRWHAERITKHELSGRIEEALLNYNPHLPYIGYHDVIEVDGNVRSGRGENEAGSHAAQVNEHSLGVCLIGLDRFTKAQWEALAGYVLDARRRYGPIKIFGHRDVPGTMKSCPGFSVIDWLKADMQPKQEMLYA